MSKRYSSQRQRRDRSQQPTKHHIFPKSRKVNDNIAIVPRQMHDRYHALFMNLTPDEIIRYLVEHYWNGQWCWVIKALDERRE